MMSHTHRITPSSPLFHHINPQLQVEESYGSEEEEKMFPLTGVEQSHQ